MNPFTDNSQIEEHINEHWEEIAAEWNWDDDQALEQFSLECAFGPEE